MMQACESVGSYKTELLAQKAIEALHQDGLDSTQATILGSIPHIGEHVAGYYSLLDRVTRWGKLGAFWGGAWGLAVGFWLFWVSGVGPLMAPLPVLIGAVATGLICALAATIYSLWIPHKTVLRYAPGDQEGIHVVLFEGSRKQIQRARQVLDNERSLAAVLNMPIATTSTVNIQG